MDQKAVGDEEAVQHSKKKRWGKINFDRGKIGGKFIPDEGWAPCLKIIQITVIDLLHCTCPNNDQSV